MVVGDLYFQTYQISQVNQTEVLLCFLSDLAECAQCDGVAFELDVYFVLEGCPLTQKMRWCHGFILFDHS